MRLRIICLAGSRRNEPFQPMHLAASALMLTAGPVWTLGVIASPVDDLILIPWSRRSNGTSNNHHYLSERAVKLRDLHYQLRFGAVTTALAAITATLLNVLVARAADVLPEVRS